jgi:hypothetical protein
MSGRNSEFHPRRRRRTILRAAVAASVLLSVVPGAAIFAGQPDAPPTPSTAEQKDEPVGFEVDAAMRKAFAGLADSDATVRDAARQSLMGLERRYLSALRHLVAERRPLLPSQAAALRQIVTHVYSAGEPYDSDREGGFLGVRMQPTTVSVKAAAAAAPDADPDEPRMQYGVVIVERLAGFIGNRMLMDGDVILAIVEHPGLQFASDSAFSLAVKDTGAGHTVHFHVLRRGRLVKIAVTLDPRPNQAADPNAMEALNKGRRDKAETYWREAFAPLLREGVG